MSRIWVGAFLAFILLGCTTEPVKRYAVGGVSKVRVVMDQSLVGSEIDSTIIEILSETVKGVPQPEKQFEIVRIAAKDFKEIQFLFNKIIFVEVDPTMDVPSFEYTKDKHVDGQTLVYIKVPSSDKKYTELLARGGYIRNLFHKQDLSNLIRYNVQNGEPSLRSHIQDEFGISVGFQPFTKLVVQDSSTIVTHIHREFEDSRNEKHVVDQNLIIHKQPYYSTSQLDSVFVDQLRDSLWDRYIDIDGGSLKTSFNPYVPPAFKPVNFNDSYATESTGLWVTKGTSIKGGPFYQITTVDSLNNNLVTILGYVYAPNFAKRDYLLELQAMVHSVQFGE